MFNDESIEVVDQSENGTVMALQQNQGSQNGPNVSIALINDDESEESSSILRMDRNNAYFEANSNGMNSLPYKKQETEFYKCEDAKTEFDQESIRLGTEINFDQSSGPL